MTLIDKDALVTGIENLENTYKKCPTRNSYEEGLKVGRLIGYKDALHKINTLDVKEVDLEKEIEKYCRKYYNCNYPDQIQSGKCSEVMPHIVETARRFFELGLNTQKGE